jgi:dipeptidyl aminopeptidase/acylaminoacyl peptidase
MSEALIKAGIPFEQAFYPGQKHAMGAPSMRHFYQRMEEFFDRTLQEVVVEDVEVR